MLDPGITRELVTASGNQIEMPALNDTSNVGVRLAENTAAASEGDLVFTQKLLDAYKYSSGPILVSSELLQDSALPFEQIVRAAMAERIARKVNLDLTTGDGVGDPNGIVTASTLGKTAADAPGGTAKCGNLVQGMVREFGDTTYGASFSMLTSSKREVDDWGNMDIIPRSRRKTGTFEVVVQKRLVDETARILTELTDTPCVFIGTGEYASALYFGIWRDWSIAVEQPLTSILSIQIEGYN